MTNQARPDVDALRMELLPRSVSQDGQRVSVHFDFCDHAAAAEFRVKAAFRIEDGDFSARFNITRATPASGEAAEGAGDVHALAEIWRICDRASYYSKSRLVGAIAQIVQDRTKARAASPPKPVLDALVGRAERTTAVLDQARHLIATTDASTKGDGK